MIETILPAILTTILMFEFSIFIFRNITKRINTRLKKHFIDNLQDYNYLIEEKKDELESLRKKVEEERAKLPINNKQEEVPQNLFSKEVEEKLRKMKKYKSGEIKLVDTEDIIYDIPTPKYKEEEFFKNYKELKKNFKVNAEKTLIDFIKEHKNTKKEDEKYKTLHALKSKFSQNIIYECLTLSNNEQYKLMSEVLEKKEKEVLNFESKFSNDKEFTVLKLLDEVENTIKQYDPTIYVYVGQENLDYSNIGKNVKTYFYKNMSEGIIINYKGKMYDYSI